MRPRTFGETRAGRCERCAGVWIETRHFNDLVMDLDRQMAVLEAVEPGELVDDTPGELRCVACAGLMPRRDFARDTGVFVNACRRHGMWLDPGELRLVVELLGGLGTRADDVSSETVFSRSNGDEPAPRKRPRLESLLETLVDVLAWLNRSP